MAKPLWAMFKLLRHPRSVEEGTVLLRISPDVLLSATSDWLLPMEEEPVPFAVNLTVIPECINVYK